jgi:hypothetical protein
MSRRLDLLALAASLIALTMTALYLLLVLSEGNDPTAWAVVGLVGSGLGAAYAARQRARGRRAVLTVCALVLGALGYVALLSVGMPRILAAALCAAAVLRGRPARDWRDSV